MFYRPGRYDNNPTVVYLIIFPLLGLIISASIGWIIGAVMEANTIKTHLVFWMGIAGFVIGIIVAGIKILGFLK
jgi:hypothetical protein